MIENIKAYFTIGFFSLVVNCGIAQNQKLADSLIHAYNTGSYDGNEFVILKNIASNETNPERKLEFSELLIEKGSADSLFNFLHVGYLQKGNALRIKGDLAEALKSYFKSIQYANRIGDNLGVAKVTISIADTYSEIGSSGNAETYYNQGILLLRQSNDSISLATALLNAGDEYFNSKKYDSAILYFQEAAPIFIKINSLIGTAYTLGNLGMVYAEQGKDNEAEHNINEAIKILEDLGDYYPISVYLTYMSDIYQRQNDFSIALTYALRSLALATRYRIKDQISEANLKISEIFDKVGNPTTSYKYYKDHILYRDSVKNIESVQQMADLETSYQVSQKQVEVDLLNQQKKTQKIIAFSTGAGMFLIGIIAIGLYRRNKFIQKAKQLIEVEKGRSDALLLNILPFEIAEELKANGSAEAREFENVSILFTDFKEFTSTSEKLTAQELVAEINICFQAFDAIVEKYGIEKIKTIGDAYMAAGGLPVPSLSSTKNTVLAGLEMQDFMKTRKTEKFSKGEVTFDMRVGIHTGTVIAGIVGSKKFQYDVWGDTVNTSSRIETTCEVDKVNISHTTYELVKNENEFTIESRGKIQAKGKGELEMYFVSKKNG